MEFVKIGTVCKLRNGFAFKSTNFTETGVPIIRISNISDNIVSPEKSVRTTYENVFDNYKIINGDILIAMSGATTGKFGIYKADEIAYQNQRVGCFKILDHDILNQTYLLQVLNTIKPIIEKTANGGAQPNISANAIEEITIPLPSLPDQIRIAEILTQAENLITQRKESILLMDELLKSTFLEMFGDPTTNQKQFPKATIRDLVIEVKYGTSKPAEDEGIFPYLRMNNITYDGYMDYSNLKYINLEKKDEAKYVVKKGDILFNRTNSKELVGKAGVYNEISEMVIAGYLIRIRTNERANPYFIWGYLNSIHGKKTLFNMCKSIVGMANINAQELQDIKILIPTLDLQNKYEILVEKVETLKKDYQASLKELENMYGVLSQNFFKYELQIDKKKSDEITKELNSEDFNVEKYIKEMEASKNNTDKRDITNMTFAEYVDFPEEYQQKDEKWMFMFLGKDEFYQFLLKDGFKDIPFNLEDLENRFHNFFYHGGDMDFDNEKWRSVIFKFIEANPPLIKQIFDEKSATIKLQLTDEAFKA